MTVYVWWGRTGEKAVRVTQPARLMCLGGKDVERRKSRVAEDDKREEGKVKVTYVRKPQTS